MSETKRIEFAPKFDPLVPDCPDCGRPMRLIGDYTNARQPAPRMYPLYTCDTCNAESKEDKLHQYVVMPYNLETLIRNHHDQYDK